MRCVSGTCLYKMNELKVVVYVDELFYCGKEENFQEFERYIKDYFKITGTSNVETYVGS